MSGVMPARKLVLFDIDGTILLSSGAGRRAIVGAIAEHIGDAGALSHIPFGGKTDPQIVAELLAAAGHQEPPTPDRLDGICRIGRGRTSSGLVNERTRRRAPRT